MPEENKKGEISKGESELRIALANLFMTEYMPKIKKEVARYAEESYPRMAMSEQVSNIIGAPVTVFMGDFRIAKPTNELIDSLVKMIYVETK